MRSPAPLLSVVLLLLASRLWSAEEGTPPTPPPPRVAEPKAAPSPTVDELYDLGKHLFDTFAPEQIKQEYEFVSREEWSGFFDRLDRVLQSGTLNDLAAYAPEAHAAVAAARVSPDEQTQALTAWLAERADLADAAAELARVTPAPVPPPQTVEPPPGTPPLTSTRVGAAVPYLDLWQRRIAQRPLPAAASTLMPELKEAFAREGVPPALAWLAEVESSFDPSARSPAGAKGLFQLMPATAEGLGLSTAWPDERTHPTKSAEAAARYLRQLHREFADWTLALAAYNAGQGRVRRALSSREAKTFAEVSPALPVETRLYVPKVLATVAVREGVRPDQLPPPGPRPRADEHPGDRD